MGTPRPVIGMGAEGPVSWVQGRPLPSEHPFAAPMTGRVAAAATLSAAALVLAYAYAP